MYPLELQFAHASPLSADTAQLAEVILTSAVISEAEGPPAPWVEFCSCPVGFMGQFCEQCSRGFTREHPGRGPLSACVPCNCHQHGTCHPETGKTLTVKCFFI
uniref:Laminin EGF-like domain-containing protein n=1 Tax=Knipowitschia caucasica TaxID=637954 RepID=A0AAV2IXG7_KNICA